MSIWKTEGTPKARKRNFHGRHLRLQSTGVAANFWVMSKATTLNSAKREAGYRAQAEHYLAETNRILKKLAQERSRQDRRRDQAPNILATVKSILRGA